MCVCVCVRPICVCLNVDYVKRVIVDSMFFLNYESPNRRNTKFVYFVLAAVSQYVMVLPSAGLGRKLNRPLDTIQIAHQYPPEFSCAEHVFSTQTSSPPPHKTTQT